VQDNSVYFRFRKIVAEKITSAVSFRSVLHCVKSGWTEVLGRRSKTDCWCNFLCYNFPKSEI